MSYQVEEFEVPITWTENYTKGWVEKSGDTYIAKINGTDPKAHWSGYSVYAKVNLRTFAESRIRNLQSIAKIYVSELRIDGHWWASNFYGTAWNWISYKGVSEKRMTIKGDEGWKENKMKINEEISVDNPYVTLVHEAGGDAVLPFGYAEVGTSNPKLFITVYYFGEPPPIENLSIEVKGEDGNPIQNATVYVYKGVRLLKKGKTAYDGTVQFALPSGAYGVVVEASGYYRWEGKLNTGAMIHEITLKKVRLVPPIRLPPAQDVLPYVIIAGAIVVAGAVAYMYYKRGAVASEIASKIARRIA